MNFKYIKVFAGQQRQKNRQYTGGKKSAWFKYQRILVAENARKIQLQHGLHVCFRHI